jgi:hypothetical protein
MVILYLDPGAGSLIVQGILAAILAVPYLLRNRIASLVGRLRRRNSTGDGSEL